MPPPPIGLRGHCTHLKYRFISLYPSLVWYLKKKYENADFIKLGFVSIWVHPRQFHDYLCQFYLEQAIKTIMFAQASIFWLETNWKLYQSFNWVITVGAKGRMAAPNRMNFWENSKLPSKCALFWFFSIHLLKKIYPEPWNYYFILFPQRGLGGDP